MKLSRDDSATTCSTFFTNISHVSLQKITSIHFIFISKSSQWCDFFKPITPFYDVVLPVSRLRSSHFDTWSLNILKFVTHRSTETQSSERVRMPRSPPVSLIAEPSQLSRKAQKRFHCNEVQFHGSSRIRLDSVVPDNDTILGLFGLSSAGWHSSLTQSFEIWGHSVVNPIIIFRRLQYLGGTWNIYQCSHTEFVRITVSLKWALFSQSYFAYRCPLSFSGRSLVLQAPPPGNSNYNSTVDYLNILTILLCHLLAHILLSKWSLMDLPISWDSSLKRFLSVSQLWPLFIYTWHGYNLSIISKHCDQNRFKSKDSTKVITESQNLEAPLQTAFLVQHVRHCEVRFLKIYFSKLWETDFTYISKLLERLWTDVDVFLPT